MNSGCLESSVGLDRLATQDEVRSAILFSSPADLVFFGLRDNFSEMNSDASRRAPSQREEIEWLMIVGAMRNCIGN
jgi:hypothetical protein